MPVKIEVDSVATLLALASEIVRREPAKADSSHSHLMNLSEAHETLKQRLAGEIAQQMDQAAKNGFVFVGHLDVFDGSAYRVAEDGHAFFRIFDPEEPHGQLKVDVSPVLRQQIKELGLAPKEQRIRVTIEVLP